MQQLESVVGRSLNVTSWSNYRKVCLMNIVTRPDNIYSKQYTLVLLQPFHWAIFPS